MGFFDSLGNLSPEQTQGLLAAAASLLKNGGPSLTSTGNGQAFGGAIDAFQGGLASAQQRKLQLEQAQQAAQLHGLQIQGLTGELQDKDIFRKQNLDAQQFLRNYNAGATSPTRIAQSVLGSDLAPTVDNASRLSQAQTTPGGGDSTEQLFNSRIAQAAAMRATGNPQLVAQADALEKQALSFRPEFDQTPRFANGPDGKPFAYVLDKSGSQRRLDGVLPRDERKMVDLGGRQVAYDPFAIQPGQSFGKTMTPGETASNGIAQERLKFDMNSPQYMDTESGVMALPKQLAPGASPSGIMVNGLDGQPLQKKQSIPQYVVEGITNNAKSLASIDAALASLKTDTGKSAVGFKGYLPNSILNRSYPEGTETRANIADVGSLVLHDRSGAAVTASESPRLLPFIPLATDDPDTATKKLVRFKQAFEAENNNLTFQFPGAKKLADYAAANSAKAAADAKASADAKAGATPPATEREKTLPRTNTKGWPLHVDASGNKAYVSPNGKSYEEVK